MILSPICLLSVSLIQEVSLFQCPADQVGAMNFAFAITAALLHCERTGEGQKIETSQLGAW